MKSLGTVFDKNCQLDSNQNVCLTCYEIEQGKQIDLPLFIIGIVYFDFIILWVSRTCTVAVCHCHLYLPWSSAHRKPRWEVWKSTLMSSLLDFLGLSLSVLPVTSSDCHLFIYERILWTWLAHVACPPEPVVSQQYNMSCTVIPWNYCFLAW